MKMLSTGQIDPSTRAAICSFYAVIEGAKVRKGTFSI